METVLLVEDEDAVRSTIRRVLERLGYTVLEAKDSEEAVCIALEDTRIDLLLTDVVLPKVSGPELALALRRTRPALSVLFTTGYVGENEALDRAVALGARVLAKPFGLDELAREVVCALHLNMTCP